MKKFFLFCLVLLIAAGGYYYVTETAEYEMKRRAAKKEYNLSHDELDAKKKELELLIKKASLPPAAPENEEEFPDLPSFDSYEEKAEPFSEEIQHLEKTVNDKSDLLKRKQTLQKILETSKQKQTVFEQNVEKRIEDNYRIMEKRRTNAYQAFEKRMAADKTKLSEGKGPRYAAEKKKLDQKAVTYQNAVNAQNERLRNKALKRREKLSSLEEKIQDRINSIDTLLTRETISDTDRQKLNDDISEIITQSDVPPDTKENPLNLDSEEKINMFQKELITVNMSEKELKDKYDGEIKKLAAVYDNTISTIKFFGGGAAFVLLLLIFVSHLLGRYQD